MRAVILAIIWSFLLLGGCSERHKENLSYSAEIDGQNVAITFNKGGLSEGTIDDGKHIYIFSYLYDGSLSITYPDGYVYTQTKAQGAIFSPADYDADEIKNKGYIDGSSLAWAISSADYSEGARRQQKVPLIISLLLIAGGVSMAVAPKNAWWISKGWQYKNAEPSDLALILYSAGGCILMLVGIISLFS